MSKDFDYWRPLLSNVCIDNLSAEKTELLLHSEDVEDIGSQLFMTGTPKNMLSRVPLGVIELRDKPIERISYRGTLDRKNRIASLIVLAGYKEAENFNSLTELSENLKTRAEHAINPPVIEEPAEETDIITETSETMQDSETISIWELLIKPNAPEAEPVAEEISVDEPPAESAVEPVEALEAVQAEEHLITESEALTEAETASQPMMTVIPDVTDPVVLQELRNTVEKELAEDRRNTQVAALRSLNPFKRRPKNPVMQEEEPSTARKITVVQEFSTPGALPPETIIETNVLNDDEDERILVDEWESIENLFVNRPAA